MSPGRPVSVNLFDGECGLCNRIVRLLCVRTGQGSSSMSRCRGRRRRATCGSRRCRWMISTRWCSWRIGTIRARWPLLAHRRGAGGCRCGGRRWRLLLIGNRIGREWVKGGGTHMRFENTWHVKWVGHRSDVAARSVRKDHGEFRAKYEAKWAQYFAASSHQQMPDRVSHLTREADLPGARGDPLRGAQHAGAGRSHLDDGPYTGDRALCHSAGAKRHRTCACGSQGASPGA
jgi:hypothetical protein